MITKLKVKITKIIIKESAMCKRKLDGCAFALAVKDLFPKAEVTDNHIYPIGYNVGAPSFMMSVNMRQFINIFDGISPKERLDMPETEFELLIPEWAFKYMNAKKVKSIATGKHPTLLLKVA